MHCLPEEHTKKIKLTKWKVFLHVVGQQKKEIGGRAPDVLSTFAGVWARFLIGI
jgi:hypothetical protein